MKKLAICFLCAQPLLGMAQQAAPSEKQSYTITGHMDHVVAPATAYLFYKNRTGFQRDSAKVKDNQFVFTGTADYPQKAFLFLAPNGENANSHPSMDQVAIYIENGAITVNTKDSLKNARVGGTQLNRDQQDYINAIGNLRVLQAQINAQFNNVKDPAKQEALTNDYKQLDVLLQTSLANFITTHPNSQVALNCMRANFKPADNVELATSLYNSLTDSIKNVASALSYKDDIENTFKLSVGKPAPDFTAKDLKGNEKHLSDFKGKYVLLDFWASWCGPCRRESPNLVESYGKFKDKKFEIVSFSLDDDAADWEKAVNADKYVWTNLRQPGSEPNSVSKLYSISGIPTNFLLDPTGKIIAMNLRGKELEEKLTEIIN